MLPPTHVSILQNVHVWVVSIESCITIVLARIPMPRAKLCMCYESSGYM
jgi:hypothetical protein